MTSQVTIRREVEKLKEATQMRKGPNIIWIAWFPDRGDGKDGFARFNMRTKKKTPLTDEEVKQLRAKVKNRE